MYILQRFAVVLFFVLGVDYAYSMRCSNNLVTEGDSVIKLLSDCGAPLYKTEDFFRDRATYVYKIDSAVYTITLLKNIITDIDMDRSL